SIHGAVLNPLVRGAPENLVVCQSRCLALFVTIAGLQYSADYDDFDEETLGVPRPIIDASRTPFRQPDLRGITPII
ncbi:MAG: hypothetical protein ACKVJN_02650, partial [Woeseiales bacterium]